MKRKQIKFVIGSVIIVTALAVIGFTSFQDNKSYYQTVSELYATKDMAYGRKLRVEGDVVAGSIARGAKETHFVIGHTDDKTKVAQTLSVRGPQCGSLDTRETTRCGPTACTSLWVCGRCRDPFDQFKAL